MVPFMHCMNIFKFLTISMIRSPIRSISVDNFTIVIIFSNQQKQDVKQMSSHFISIVTTASLITKSLSIILLFLNFG